MQIRIQRFDQTSMCDMAERGGILHLIPGNESGSNLWGSLFQLLGSELAKINNNVSTKYVRNMRTVDYLIALWLVFTERLYIPLTAFVIPETCVKHHHTVFTSNVVRTSASPVTPGEKFTSVAPSKCTFSLEVIQGNPHIWKKRSIENNSQTVGIWEGWQKQVSVNNVNIYCSQSVSQPASQSVSQSVNHSVGLMWAWSSSYASRTHQKHPGDTVSNGTSERDIPLVEAQHFLYAIASQPFVDWSSVMSWLLSASHAWWASYQSPIWTRAFTQNPPDT